MLPNTFMTHLIPISYSQSQRLFVKFCLLTALCGPAVLPATAQHTNTEPATDPVGVRHIGISKHGQQVDVRFDLILDTLRIPSNQAIRLTPVLTAGDSLVQLPPVTIAGRRRYIVHQRQGTKGLLVRRKDGIQEVSYSTRTPYREWMNHSQLVWAHHLCGCRDEVLRQQTTPLSDICFEVRPYEVQPQLSFVAPRVEAVKYREESGQAFLDFPVNQTVIYPDYRRNITELDKIMATIDLVRNDSNTSITHIDIHGYASPEGSYANNRRLAQGRAEALKQYVRDQYTFSDTIFSVQSTPEDWKGLRRWVEQSAVSQRDEILRIIDSPLDEDAKNTRLQRMGDGSLYDMLLRQVYPALRHSDYKVHYTVRPFSIEETRRLLHTRPQLLSLDEMYRLASTYETGSDEFNEVFDIAVHLFPDDPAANLNAALVAFGERNCQRAARYLERAGQAPEAVHARGILALLNGNLDEAETLLKQAEALGITQATENLRQLELKRQNLKQTEANKSNKL